MSDTQPKMAIRTKSEPISTRFTVMFDSEIEDSHEYHEHFYVMEQAREQDIVDVCISSIGGSVATISKFQDVVKNSSAHFHGKLHGYGYSAGGALFLLCDTQEVSDLATFMAHSIQTGYGGGTQATESHSKMSSKQNEQLCRMLYTDFLTEEEIVRICDGAEIWMDATEIRERLANRETIRHQREVDAAKEEYTPEVHASQILEDISEDCETFGYSVDEIISLVKGMLTVVEVEEQLPDVEEEFPANLNALEEVYSSGYMIGGSHIDIYHCDRELLKFAANTLGIKFAHNLHTETLRKKVLDFLEK